MPHPVVLKSFAAVAVMLGYKTDWESCRKMLGSQDFLQKLMNYDKDNIAEAKIKKLGRSLADPDLTV